MKRRMIILLLFASIASAAETPLALDWSNSISKGVQRIDLLDLDKDWDAEIYAISTGATDETIYAYTIDGGLIYDTTVPRYGLADYGNEDFILASVSDWDGNGYLDIVSATEIKASSINNHRLYRIQRIPEEGLDRLYNRLIWVVKDSGLITSIGFEDVEGDGTLEAVTSSVDQEIRAYKPDGSFTVKAKLEGSVWDLRTVNIDADNNTEYLAAAFKGLYLLDDNGAVIWSSPSDSRFDIASSYDINGDGRPEFMGVSEDVLYALDINGKTLWGYRTQNIKAVEGVRMAYLEDAYVLVAAGDKLVFLDKDGEVMWEQEVPDRILTVKPLEVGGVTHILLGTEDGISEYRIDDSKLKAEKAFTFYHRAGRDYEEGRFNDSIYYAGKAANLYRDISLAENETNALELVSKAGNVSEAERFYSTALMDFEAGRYNQSIMHARMAEQIYASQEYEPGVAKSTSLQTKAAEKAREAIRVADEKRIADEYYSLAESEYVNGSYKTSLEYARMAQDAYNRLQYTPGVKLAEKLVSMNLEGIGETTTTLQQVTTTTLGGLKITSDDIVTYSALSIALLILGGVAASRLKKK
ncbi:MAG: PQQ-binding-like beta-propeller repeat protein [Candidatus Altiarchaeota archaeon]